MDELIANAYLAAGRIADDLLQAHASRRALNRPEGYSMADKALMAYLTDCRDIALKLQNALIRIAP